MDEYLAFGRFGININWGARIVIWMVLVEMIGELFADGSVNQFVDEL